MAYDGIITLKMVEELKELLVGGKIDRVQQPTKEELIFLVHTRSGNHRLYASVGNYGPRVHLIESQPDNPPNPFPFCMLMRKHLVGARILDISQYNGDRIIEISLEAMNELGFTLSKKLIFEIMGKHSNIILVDIESGKVIDSIKRISIDTSRARQILPGIIYQYPPPQDKIPFTQISEEELKGLLPDGSAILKAVGGISPQIAEELARRNDRWSFLSSLISDRTTTSLTSEDNTPHIYLDEAGSPVEFHVASLSEYEANFTRRDFDSLSKCIEYYFDNRDATNRNKQMSHGLSRNLESLIDKHKLKLQRLNEDLLAAENSENYRLYGELLTANLHQVKQGEASVKLTSYYDGSTVEIPLDASKTPAKNAQDYFKKYGKAKTAIKEKHIQIEETIKDIKYLESVQTALENIKSPEEIGILRSELEETGYLKKKRTREKVKRFKVSPHRFTSPSGFEVLVGRNNKENDELTLKIADRNDLWLHTKDIPGSHVILRTAGKEPAPEDIYYAASIAAWHSKAKDSGQVPVDYVKVKNVKKPSGAKPGMVIFTDNRTVYVEPRES